MEIKPELECHKYSDTYCYELVDKGNAPSGICIKNPNCEYRKNKYKEQTMKESCTAKEIKAMWEKDKNTLFVHKDYPTTPFKILEVYQYCNMSCAKIGVSSDSGIATWGWYLSNMRPYIPQSEPKPSVKKTRVVRGTDDDIDTYEKAAEEATKRAKKNPGHKYIIFESVAFASVELPEVKIEKIEG